MIVFLCSFIWMSQNFSCGFSIKLRDAKAWKYIYLDHARCGLHMIFLWFCIMFGSKKKWTENVDRFKKNHEYYITAHIVYMVLHGKCHVDYPARKIINA